LPDLVFQEFRDIQKRLNLVDCQPPHSGQTVIGIDVHEHDVIKLETVDVDVQYFWVATLDVIPLALGIAGIGARRIDAL
jgi:hypothetical protein